MQRYELFVHAFNVSTDVVVKSVAVESRQTRVGERTSLDEQRLPLAFV